MKEIKPLTSLSAFKGYLAKSFHRVRIKNGATYLCVALLYLVSPSFLKYYLRNGFLNVSINSFSKGLLLYGTIFIKRV